MFVVYNRLNIPASHASEFEKLFIGSFEHMKGVPGLRRTTLQRPHKPEDPYVSTMEFEDAAAFQAWMKSDSFKASHQVPEGTPREAMGMDSVISTYDVIADVTP